MRIFNEEKTQKIFSPDLSKGYLKDDKLFIAHHDAIEAVAEQGHWETKAEYPNGGKDVEWVVDVPAVEACEAYDEYEDIQVYIPYTQDQINEILNRKYIPNVGQSISVIGKMFLKTVSITDTEIKISVSGLYETWAAGKYEIGDMRNHAGQTWECIQAHDNAVYPDIKPDNVQTWATFWKPLHGKSINTARPWVKPQYGTTDMYHVGEYMVYTDGKVYKCLSDTVYSPEEYAQAWDSQ